MLSLHLQIGRRLLFRRQRQLASSAISTPETLLFFFAFFFRARHWLPPIQSTTEKPLTDVFAFRDQFKSDPIPILTV